MDDLRTRPPSDAPAGHVVVRDLSKAFGPVVAVDGVSFTIRPGRVTGFLGPNGAGKTTTLRMVLGLVRPDRGSATIGGLEYRDLPAPLQVVGAALEESGAHPGRTGRDHLLVTCAAAGLDPGHADLRLEEVGLASAGNRKVGQYSLGMRQRLAIARALLGDPHTLILDEPVNGLDPEGIAWLRDLVGNWAASGRTVVFSSHLLGEIETVADDVVILARGRLLAHAPVATLRDNLGETRIHVRTSNPEALAAALSCHGARVTRASGAMVVTGPNAEQIQQAARHCQAHIEELRVLPADLEQAFLKLTHGLAGIK